MKLTYTVRRGRNAGAILTPHQHKDGRFVVSESRFKKDYRYCDTVAEAWELMRKHGLSIRMSDKQSLVSKAPSLVSLKNVEADAET